MGGLSESDGKSERRIELEMSYSMVGHRCEKERKRHFDLCGVYVRAHVWAFLGGRHCGFKEDATFCFQCGRHWVVAVYGIGK